MRWEKHPWLWMIAWMIVGAAIFAAGMFVGARTEPITPDDWFSLLAGIERDVAEADTEHRVIRNLEADDRKFIRKMANELSVGPDAKPTAAQGQWLLSIRAWIDASKASAAK